MSKKEYINFCFIVLTAIRDTLKVHNKEIRNATTKTPKYKCFVINTVEIETSAI
jgi:hypothetical protein